MRAALTIAARGIAVTLCAGLLSACGMVDDSTVNVVVIGSPSEPFERGTRLSPPGQLVRAATTEGLVAFDAEGRVVPALADRWIVTDDGLSYIFRLRDGTWLDGSALTANGATAELRLAIEGLKGTSLGFDLAGVDEVRVMALRVVEIRLSRPMSNLLQLLAQPELGLRHAGRGAGPMALRRDGDTAILTLIDPKDRGLPAIEDWNDRVRTLRLVAMPADKAVERLTQGDADLLLGGTVESFPLAKSVGILRGTIQLDPVIGLFGLAVLNANGFLSLPENREAIAMAIDREALIEPFGVSGWTPTTRIVAPGLDGDSGQVGERWPGTSLAERRAIASARVIRWRERTGGPARMRIALPAGPGADMLFRRLQADFAAIGLQAVRARPGGAADLALVDDIARYPHAEWFINRLHCGIRRALCDTNADMFAAEASQSADPAERATLLAQAEAELAHSNVFIPFGAPIRWSLVRGNASGFATNRWGWHPLMPMAMRPR